MIIETMKLWEDRDDVELTSFLVPGDPFLPTQSGRPAVLVCPGGAYKSCPRHGREGDPIAMTYAIDGFQGFVLEYSVADKAPEGKCLFPAQILDLGKAILTIQEHAAEWNVDADKIILIGFSAGAHLCSMYATTWKEGLLGDYFQKPAEVFKPLAAILLYGLFDYVVQENARKQGVSVNLGADINVPVFGVENPPRELLEKYSAVSHVSQDTPPMFLAAAVDDGLVPSIQSLLMAQKLHENKVPYELHMFQYGDHGFDLGRNFFEPYRHEKVRNCSQWVPLSKQFIMHQLSEESRELEKSPFTDFKF